MSERCDTVRPGLIMAEARQYEAKRPDSIREKFRYHKPGEAVEELHQRVRDCLFAVAAELDKLLPASMEAHEAQKKLREAMFWANAAIACNQR